MKKFLSIALSLILVLGMFAACDSANKNQTPETEPNVTDPVDQPNVDDVTEGSIASFNTVTPGKLTMATNAFFPPYEYYEGETIVGIDAESAAAIAEKLGLELVIDNMEFNSIITAVSTGAADMGLAGMTVTEERKLEVNFSTSYAKGVQSIIVKEGSAITSYDDLAAEGAGGRRSHL